MIESIDSSTLLSIKPIIGANNFVDTFRLTLILSLYEFSKFNSTSLLFTLQVFIFDLL